MAINVDLTKTKTENGVSFLKRFTRKIQESGIIMKVKGNRYASRDFSKLKRKKDKLIKLEGKGKYENLKKMGKLKVRTYSPRPSAPTPTTPSPAPVATVEVKSEN
jgi:ribosomal protein S21